MSKSINFTSAILSWFDQHGRTTLPWQQDINPYRVWVSEIMLQQTQVATVIDYFNRFMSAFPTVEKLAAAHEDEVLHVWTGLGYYSRARNLHKAAKVIINDFAGKLPHSIDQLTKLPGIGRSTAGAIASISMNIPAPILDGNVKRVLTRFHAVDGWPGHRDVEKKLWMLSEKYTSHRRPAHYTQGIMDVGATVCTPKKPSCDECPLTAGCQAFAQGNPLLYPTPKPKKCMPTKTTIMVLLQNKDGHILLEKRPPTGIWGGLWSLPECDDETAIKTHCATQFGLKTITLTTLPAFRHTFSHYHLDITPVLMSTTPLNTPPLMESPDRIWYNPNKPDSRGLPAPIKKLIEELSCLQE